MDSLLWRRAMLDFYRCYFGVWSGELYTSSGYNYTNMLMMWLPSLFFVLFSTGLTMTDSVRRGVDVSGICSREAFPNMTNENILMHSNRIDEASTLFESVANSRWFGQSSLVLFLNKTGRSRVLLHWRTILQTDSFALSRNAPIDLFKNKLRVSPLNHYMPNYVGDNEFGSASAFMLHHFTSLLRNPNKRLYSHFTCATDKEQTRFVLSALQDFIIKQNLAASGLI